MFGGRAGDEVEPAKRTGPATRSQALMLLGAAEMLLESKRFAASEGMTRSSAELDELLTHNETGIFEA